MEFRKHTLILIKIHDYRSQVKAILELPVYFISNPESVVWKGTSMQTIINMTLMLLKMSKFGHSELKKNTANNKALVKYKNRVWCILHQTEA